MTTRIGLAADVRGWAFWNIATGIQKYAPQEYEVDVYLRGEKQARDYDAVLEMAWYESEVRGPCNRSCTLVGSEAFAYREPDKYNIASTMATQIRNRGRALEILPGFDGVLAVSPKIRDMLSVMEVDATYVPTGVDANWFVPRNKTVGDKLVVGFCGQEKMGEVGVKGFNLVFRPVQCMCGQFCQFSINNLEHRYAFDKVKMREWYQGLDVFVCCSASDGGPIPRLEAMACGVPVISTTVGDHNTTQHCWDVGSYQDLMSAGDIIGRIAWQLSELHERPEMLTHKAHSSRAHAESCCWSKLSKVWLDAIAGK